MSATLAANFKENSGIATVAFLITFQVSFNNVAPAFNVGDVSTSELNLSKVSDFLKFLIILSPC